MDESHRLNDIFNNSSQMNMANNISANERHIKVNIKIKNSEDWASFSVYAARKRDRDKESPHMKFEMDNRREFDKRTKKEYFTESFKQLSRDRLLLSWMNVDVGSLSFPNNWESGWSTYKTIIETKWALRTLIYKRPHTDSDRNIRYHLDAANTHSHFNLCVTPSISIGILWDRIE